MAREVGASVTLLKRVVPMLEREGYLRVVPKVGTFVRRLPPAVAREGCLPGAVVSPFASRPAVDGREVRLHVAEHPEVAADYWREIIAEFEKQDRRTRVKMALVADPSDPDLGADVLYVQAGVADRYPDDLVEWVEGADGAAPGAGLVPPAGELSRGPMKSRALPVAVGTAMLYANRPALEGAGLFTPPSWKTPGDVVETCRLYLAGRQGDDPVTWGWVDDAFGDLVLSGGWPLSPFAEMRATLERRLRMLATTGPPVMVAGTDSRRAGIQAEALRRGCALFVSGHCWENHFIDRRTWEALPAPYPGPRPFGHGIMVVAVSRSAPCREESIRFARFLAGEQAQGILARAAGLIPADAAAAAGHPLHGILEHYVRTAWVSEVPGRPREKLERVDRVNMLLSDVRSQRVSVEEALRRLEQMSARRAGDVGRGAGVRQAQPALHEGLEGRAGA
jgi:ABC-type glycerol-3-phosphate transport system substrate-binding protein